MLQILLSLQGRSLRTRYLFKVCILLLLTAFGFATLVGAQFVDDFEGPAVALDPEGNNGWLFLAGDGTATMDVHQGSGGYASVSVDGTTDRQGIWWALTERRLSGN
jgi:hypothetical protein